MIRLQRSWPLIDLRVISPWIASEDSKNLVTVFRD